MSIRKTPRKKKKSNASPEVVEAMVAVVDEREEDVVKVVVKAEAKVAVKVVVEEDAVKAVVKAAVLEDLARDVPNHPNHRLLRSQRFSVLKLSRYRRQCR